MLGWVPFQPVKSDMGKERVVQSIATVIVLSWYIFKEWENEPSLFKTEPANLFNNDVSAFNELGETMKLSLQDRTGLHASSGCWTHSRLRYNVLLMTVLKCFQVFITKVLIIGRYVGLRFARLNLHLKFK